MITECSKYPKENREKMTKIMFETFNVPGLYIANPGLLNMYSVGKYIGITVDLGYGVSKFIPVFEGNSVPNANILQNLGGREMTEYMIKYLSYSFNISEKEIVKNIKKNMLCCS